MNSNKLLTGTFILALFISTACDKTGTTRSQDTEQEPRVPIPINSSHDCKAEFKSYKNMDCFYHLPNIKNGEYFTSRYEDTSNIDKAGVTLGKGQWLCQKGVWRQMYSPLCLTCLPGHSFEHCKAKWEDLYKKLY